jgi:hypothetical protein
MGKPSIDNGVPLATFDYPRVNFENNVKLTSVSIYNTPMPLVLNSPPQKPW